MPVQKPTPEVHYKGGMSKVKSDNALYDWFKARHLSTTWLAAQLKDRGIDISRSALQTYITGQQVHAKYGLRKTKMPLRIASAIEEITEGEVKVESWPNLDAQL